MVLFPVSNFLHCSDAQKVDEATLFAFVQITEQEQGFMTTATQIMPGGKEWIWHGKKFHIKLHSLVCKYFLIKT